MRYLPASFIILLSLLFMTGCVRDSDKDCPTIDHNNLELKFIYINNLDKDVFAEHINRVHVFIYDADYKLYQKQLVDKESLFNDASLKLYLPEGKYYIVCWGNALDKTSFINTELFEDLKDAYLTNNSVNANGFAPNGDPLYFAPKQSAEPIEVVVPEVGVIIKEVPFKSAHAQVKIYVKGFEDKDLTGEKLEPMLELSNVSDKYNFKLETSNTFIGYKDIAKYGLASDENTAFIQFNTPLFEEDTLLELNLRKSSTAEVLTTIRLSEFILNNQIDLLGVDQVVVPIMIEFKGAEVTIDLPSWENIPVDPEL